MAEFILKNMMSQYNNVEIASVGMSDDDAMLYTNVTDPYHSNNYEQTFSEICEGCAKLKERIFESNE